jgi:NSS family neurotransmitter:Na+ symporter
MQEREQFSSRWGLLVSVLGIAVGTGNIWRFPRIAASNGGGSFLLPWVLFLLVWSVPLIIAEFAIGKHTRYGTVGAMAKMLGSRFAWMGAFIGFVTTAIMFYYSVVAGWCLKYLFATLIQGLPQSSETADAAWASFTGSFEPVLFHFIAIAIGAYVTLAGVRGIERANRFLIPALLLIVVVAALRAVTLPGAWDGIVYFFTPDPDKLFKPEVWLNALTQNAWDTGAGWGLIMTYAVYMRKREDIALNATLVGFGNNSVSLLAGITIFAIIASVAGVGAFDQLANQSNTGLTFIWMPQLFAKMPGGQVLAPLFFLGLFFAALSSLISMIELAARIFMDAGLRRKQAILLVAGAGLLFGLPSALNMSFFENQDWVWGVGLMISGAFIAFSVIRFGPGRFRLQLINQENSDIRVGRWWEVIIRYLVPIEVIVLLGWWILLSIYNFDLAAGQINPRWWYPFSTYSVGTLIFQWAFVLAVFVMLNGWLSRRTLRAEAAS